ncbi:hypothetical protein [Thalassotalea aquiviva]|uniref:hypothetical protein n=1 Tax=Thalassotalea aquiviva TaxID=3242415 RepID=UPI00352A1AF7
MEFLILAASVALVFMAYKLYQAKQYNQFIDWLVTDIQPQLLQALVSELKQQRCQQTPNTDAHIKATQYYYAQYPVRVFQGALQRNIISKDWFASAKHKRFAAHLMASQASHRISPKRENQGAQLAENSPPNPVAKQA